MEWLRGIIKDWGIALGVLVVVFVVWNMVFSPKPTQTGPAPGFSLPDLNETVYDLGDYADQTVVLNFWFTSCGPCRREIPELAAFHTAHPEIPLFGISVDRMPRRALAAKSRQLGINYTVLHDENNRVAHDYGVSLFPATFVVVDGQITTYRMGEVTAARLEQMVASTE